MYALKDSNRPLRVMMVSQFPHKGIVVGGVEAAVQVLVEALSKRADVSEMLVLNLRPKLNKDEIERWNDKLTIHYVAGQRHLSLPSYSFCDWQKARRIAKAFHPDVVHAQGTGPHGDVGVRLRYPNVLTIHGVGSFEAELRERDNSVLGPMRVWLTRQAIARIGRNAKLVISISEFDRQRCLNQGMTRVLHIPNAVRSEFFDTELVFSDSPRILFSGVISPIKNVVGIVRAFTKVKHQIPNAVLDIVGPKADGAYYDQVMKEIDQSIRGSVIFHGSKQIGELKQLVENSSVVVLFSILENLPVAIAEALTLGKPVVSSRVGGLSDMVSDGETGFLVESGNEETLADRLVRLLKDPSLRRQMGLKARAMAMKKWSPDCVAAETMEAYKLVLEQSQHRV